MKEGKQRNKARHLRAWIDLALSLLARGAGAPLAFATNILVARLLGPAGYGSYLSLLSVALLAGAVALFGVHRVATREIATTATPEKRTVLRRVLTWSVRFAGTTTLATMVVMWLWLSLGFGLVRAGLAERILVVSLIPLSAGVLLIAGVLLGLGSTIGSQALNNAVKNGALLTGVLLLSFHFQPASTLLVFACQVLSYIFTIGLGVAGLRWTIRPLPDRAVAGRSGLVDTAASGRSRTWRRSAGYFFISSAAVLIMGRMDVVLVNGLAGATDAGIFGAANRLIQIAMIGGLVLMGWLQPRFGDALARDHYARIGTLWRQGTTLAVMLTAFPAGAAWLLASQLMGLMGSGFHASVGPFRWLLLGTLFWGTFFPVGTALLTVAGLERVLARTTWVQLGVTTTLVFLLVPRAGALGGAVAYAVGLIVASILLALATWNAVKTIGRNQREPAEPLI